MCIEEAGRIYDRKKFWAVLKRMDDDLVGNRKLAAMEKDMEMMSDGNRIMASWIDDLFAESKAKGPDSIQEQDNTERSAAGLLDLFRQANEDMNGGTRVNGETNRDTNIDSISNRNVNRNRNIDGADAAVEGDESSDDEDCELEEEETEEERRNVQINFEEVMVIDEPEVDEEDKGPDVEEDEDGTDVDDNKVEIPAYKSKKEIYEEADVEVNVAKKRGKVSIRCAKINPIAFTDIIASGWTKLKKLDLVNTRFAAKEREKRKQQIREEVYESVMGNATGVDSDNTIEGLSRLGIN